MNMENVLTKKKKKLNMGNVAANCATLTDIHD